MTAHRPTSNVTIRRFLDPWDLLCVALAPLAAMALRDPDMFTGDRISSSAIYWLIGWCMGALMLLAFHLGRSLNHFLSMREVRTVGLAAISTAALTSLLHFSLTRLDDTRRAMPWDAPKSLSDAEVYAVTAFILRENKIIGDGDVMDAASLPKVRMPNREGFVPFPRQPK